MAPATVYAGFAGKQGILTELITLWLRFPLEADALVDAATGDDPLDVPAAVQDQQWAALGPIDQIDDPVAIIREVASVTRQFREHDAD